MPLFKSKPRSKEGKKQKKKKSVFREWVDAALFAIIAATLIRTFLAEAYTIPTGSMEGSLLVNDYLFVSKVSYGPRIPMTPLAVPLVHNTMPITGGKSYSESVQWKYRRWPGFSDIERNDIVVFNFPAGDTVALEVQQSADYYSLVRAFGRPYVHSMFTIMTRPVDKKENYIKRCVAVPGDQFEIRDGQIYINGSRGEVFSKVQTSYEVRTNGQGISMDFLDEHEIGPPEHSESGRYRFTLTSEQAEALRSLSSVQTVEPVVQPAGWVPPSPGEWVYPFDTVRFRWNRDNYGPIMIPAKGTSIALTAENVALYGRLIQNYEGHDLAFRDGAYWIDGKKSDSYVFDMDYYWMMGDNRHNSADSRYWGFVPIDHVVGKAWFIWMSYGDKGIRWNRLMRSVETLAR